MHKDDLLNLYMHNPSGEYVRLVVLRKSNVNTYLQVDINNEPIIKKREGSFHPETQNFIIKGFENLEFISNGKAKKKL
ncbi:MAG: hypothetical protein HN704_18405 [Bacteroidetes bacterium]|jgi:hypothetical protein|nr:hypothetical protein [Bacteroidota bacterium]